MDLGDVPHLGDEQARMNASTRGQWDWYAPHRRAIEKLRQLDISKVEPTAHATPLSNITRPDEVRPSLPTEEALRNAPSKANGLFLVPKIVE